MHITPNLLEPSTVTLARAAKPSDVEVAKLIARREKLQGEIARISAVDAPRLAAEAAVATAEREILELDGAYQQALQAWAADGGDADTKPAPDDRRHAAAVRRVEALSQVESARIACTAVEPQVRERHLKIAEIGARLFELRVQDVVDEADRLNEQANLIALQLAEPIMKMRAIPVALRNRAASLQNRQGVTTAVQMLYGAAQRIDAIGPPDIKIGDHNKVSACVAEWERLLD